jgi:glycosidase
LQRFVELRLEYRTMLFNEIVRKAFARRPTDMRWFGALSACEEAYSKPMLMAPFIDNHDMSRFATESFPCGPRLRMALTLLLTWRGIPILTYGTECGMRGKTDGENRAPMPFGADPELTAFTRRLLRMRRSVGALTSGGVREILADREVYAFLRESPGGFALVALNNSRLRQVRELRIPELGARRRWRDPSSGMGVRLERRCLRMSLKGRSARVLLSD